MEEKRAFMILILCVASVTSVVANILDVCASCHKNATCDDKSDNSGKVCNCKSGFLGNGRTLCLDKDECQIAASNICGQHAICHNTYGSYYCTCLSGYMASNNMPFFIRNDGTHCQDIDECVVNGLCGEGGHCKNLDGSFECSCHLGYRVHKGVEPFHPIKDQTSCQVVNCGQLTLQQNSLLRSATGTTFGSMATFECDEGFLWKSGNNTSQCGADGLWSKLTMICEEILCGKPNNVPHTGHIWNGISTPGSVANYYCKQGLNHSEGSAISLCTPNGNWTEPNISCKEIDCGSPPDIPHSVLLWDHISTVGSQVAYQCQSGFYSVGEKNKTVCKGNGKWETLSLRCQEIKCQDPVFIPHTKRQWDGTSHVGGVVIYECNEGYGTRSGKNFSVCGQNGLWEESDLWCEEIICGPPQILPNTNLLWNNSTKPGSVVLYECIDGYYQEAGHNISTCLISGEWANVSLSCKAMCGPVPLLAHSEVVWRNGSVVTHRCMNGYHSWRGSNVSVCGNSGEWQRATLKCIEVKPPIHQLLVSNEKCLQWRAEKYEEESEMYRVIYTGSRNYQKAFLDKRKKFVNSKADWLEVCLNLLPATNYTVSITALSAGFTSTTTINTSLTVPAVPVVHYREYETSVPTLRLKRSPNTLDPISLYQVYVLPVEGMMVFDCSSPMNGEALGTSGSSQGCIAAQMHVSHVGPEIEFTVGDGFHYGGFFNAPLEKGRNYYVILRAVSQWKKDSKSSCVLWAKVKGTSYFVKISSLCAAALIGLIALAILLGLAYFRFSKK
ncbi:sushi domain-containing protein 1 isoform X1 [Corythoichthys intestinalis]|uniref:sushi domain-containing protein 1 isoform X1 n=1 Tax=Corythoichthys intestinalis TaxID=161448 RepID=UPI0025A67408|nr:sushi domain-containing protein 1 isoform X1 [Corythoichthys intestinalis]XP_057687734.1 sushi domain-containing protein 1 isoform X1 [Corythoichthys intestinalis]XP_057687735.1 sushi domain-containing protein 1 isoform X1 [Corythoichthys intestinalis]